MTTATEPRPWRCDGCGRIANARRRPHHHLRRGEHCGPFSPVTLAPDGDVVAPTPKPFAAPGGPLRQSILRTFDACPLSARFDVEGYRDYNTGPQALGVVFHSVAQRMLAALNKQGERQMPTQEAIEIMYEVLADPSSPHLSTEQMHDLRWIVLRFCERKWTPENFLALGHDDERLSADIRCPDGQVRTLTGLPDVIGANYPDGATVVDFKTGWGVPAAPRNHVEGEPVEGRQYLSERGVFQLDAYGCLVMHKYPAVQRVRLFELHVRKNEVREATLGRDDLEHVERHLGILLMRLDTALHAGPASDLWTPRPGKWCSYCPRKSACPIPAEERGEGAVESDAMADRYAGEMVRADGLEKDRRKALKAWFAATGYAAQLADGREVRFDGGKGGAFEIVPVTRPEAGERDDGEVIAQAGLARRGATA